MIGSGKYSHPHTYIFFIIFFSDECICSQNLKNLKDRVVFRTWSVVC